MKIIENANEFKDYSLARGRATNGVPSIWVPKSVFVGMTQDKFIGKFKIRNNTNRGRGFLCNVLEEKAKSLPCKLVIHMQNSTPRNPVFVKVNLVDWGKISEEYLGIVISGIV